MTAQDSRAIRPIEAIRKWCDARLVDAWEAAQPQPATAREVDEYVSRLRMRVDFLPNSARGPAGWSETDPYYPAGLRSVNERHRKLALPSMTAAARAMSEALTERLVAGDLYATGYAGRGMANRQAIPPDMWEALDGFDVLAARATLNGIEWTGILINDRAWQRDVQDGDRPNGNGLLIQRPFDSSASVTTPAAPTTSPFVQGRTPGVGSLKRLKAALVADISARAASSPEYPTETKKDQRARLEKIHGNIPVRIFNEARAEALALFEAWTTPGRPGRNRSSG